MTDPANSKPNTRALIMVLCAGLLGTFMVVGSADEIDPGASTRGVQGSYKGLRTDRGQEAALPLRRILAAAPANEEAKVALGQTLAPAPADEQAKPGLGQAPVRPSVEVDRRLRPGQKPDPAARARRLRVAVRAGKQYFEIREKGKWRPILVKGVNLGVALPGRFPAEFPQSESLYRDWLSKLREMNANVVRLYTLLPPVFYRALAKENRTHSEAPVRLVQGIWAELPPDNNFDDPGWNAEYAAEIRRVVDAVHGNIRVVPRPGHASGLYDTDVSPWLLAVILGREWEPFAVEAFDRRGDAAARTGSFGGRYVRVARGTRMERWIAATLEIAAAHEAETYGESRPLAFTNWPTLDPLTHPTEASRQEEDAILKKLGRERPAVEEIVYDNDAVSVDAEAMSATAEYPAGLFASYHAYPYFPDFMILDPGYLKQRDREGANAYAGYLRDLVRHHAGRPVLIAEVGVPSSRGVAHRQPQGFDHGGHDEKAQAAIDARLVRTVQETGCAGAIVFSWLDEWFKHNWLVRDLETPPDRKPLWLNALDPEENFGIMAAVAGPAEGSIILDGRDEDWKGLPPVYAPRPGAIRALYATSDEAYLYLRLDLDPGPAGSEEGAAARAAPLNYWIGIDTYDRDRGDRALPGLIGTNRIPSGLEFAVCLDGVDPRILVDTPYDIGTHRDSGPYASVANKEGRFIPMTVEIRMERVGRDGTIYPAQRHELSSLRAQTTDPRSPDSSTLGDAFLDERRGIYELRLPWNLLNVTDPSSRRVVHQVLSHPPPIDTTVTDGFVFYVAAVPVGGDRPFDERPEAGETVPLYTWKTWEEPRYHLRLKPVYESLRRVFGRIEPLRPEGISESR